MSVSHVTQKMSEIDISQSSTSTKPGFTRVSRTDASNMFGSSARAPPRAPPAKAKIGTNGKKTAKPITSSNTLMSNTNPHGNRPPLVKLQQHPSANSSRMGPPSLAQKASQSSLKSASSFNTNSDKLARSVNPAKIPVPPSPTKVPAPSTASQVDIDIGKYDGGFERDNERRGSAVYGEAAEILNLDSSTSA